MKELLTSGNPEAMSHGDAYEQALEQLRAMKADELPEEEDDFAEEGGDDPFAFDFGANAEKPEKSRRQHRIDSAQERFDNREQNAKGGGLFGGEDMQARAGFAKLPDGAGILFVDGEFEGETGKIVRDEDPSTGKPRIVAEVDGRKGTVPISPDAIEPLDAHLSWRTDTAYGESKQGGLFTADQFPPKRSTQRSAGGVTRKSATPELHRSPRYRERGGKWFAICEAGVCRPVTERAILSWLNS